MNLKQARSIARRVGAQIKELSTGGSAFKVKIGVMTAGDPNYGYKEFFVDTELQAAHCAVMETAKACQALLIESKQIYIDENLLFEEGRTHG